jgi:hypothetical protein
MREAATISMARVIWEILRTDRMRRRISRVLANVSSSPEAGAYRAG